VTINGEYNANTLPILPENFNSYAAYVMQNDILLQTMTPRECLTFAANLRLQGSEAYKK